jgi:hypothetical protein
MPRATKTTSSVSEKPDDVVSRLKWLQDVTDEQMAAAAQLFESVLNERTALLRAKKDGLLNRDREL